MMRKIRDEWFVIRQVCDTIWRQIKFTKSLRPLQILWEQGEYKIDEYGPARKGTYYRYMKDFWLGNIG